ncbi:hypothetical protein HYPSUDRAFT_331601 [Hypholoma sublateritium FD-334 SS-4]|uniref:Uncharacterized protein n=1 Tax=Hypholoma sublateritium (strain FD-334 SS-4) TaxID=945553 RepID=A0A0D2P6C3_HYPSF|nr:hypothetical protein HYPSUDRAFT_331601 [Hypholoma sublateritium FD-334 SS-4]
MASQYSGFRSEQSFERLYLPAILSEVVALRRCRLIGVRGIERELVLGMVGFLALYRCYGGRVWPWYGATWGHGDGHTHWPYDVTRSGSQATTSHPTAKQSASIICPTKMPILLALYQNIRGQLCSPFPPFQELNSLVCGRHDVPLPPEFRNIFQLLDIA